MPVSLHGGAGHVFKRTIEQGELLSSSLEYMPGTLVSGTGVVIVDISTIVRIL